MSTIDKARLIDKMGRPLTQGLFLELNYDTEYAVFTFSDDDKIYKGIKYPSLKKLFLSCDDPTEYQFASKYLLNWKHWQRMNENKMLREHFDEWREEFEVKLRSEGILSIMEMTAEGTNFQAAKWIADKGWDKRPAGRPSKAEIERSKRINDKINNEFSDDFDRMNIVELEFGKNG